MAENQKEKKDAGSVEMRKAEAKRADGAGKVTYEHPVFSGDTPTARFAAVVAYLIASQSGVTNNDGALAYACDAVEAKIKNVLSQKARNAPDEDTRRFKEIQEEISKGNFAHADEIPALLERMKGKASA